MAIERASSRGVRELESLMQGALRRNGLLSEAKELGVESLVIRAVSDDEDYRNVALAGLVTRVKEMKARALVYGVHDRVDAAFAEGDMEKVTMLLAAYEDHVRRVREIEALEALAKNLSGEQLDTFRATLAQLRGLLDSPKEFRAQAHILTESYSRR